MNLIVLPITIFWGTIAVQAYRNNKKQIQNFFAHQLVQGKHKIWQLTKKILAKTKSQKEDIDLTCRVQQTNLQKDKKMNDEIEIQINGEKQNNQEVKEQIEVKKFGEEEQVLKDSQYLKTKMIAKKQFVSKKSLKNLRKYVKNYKDWYFANKQMVTLQHNYPLNENNLLERKDFSSVKIIDKKQDKMEGRNNKNKFLTEEVQEEIEEELINSETNSKKYNPFVNDLNN